MSFVGCMVNPTCKYKLDNTKRNSFIYDLYSTFILRNLRQYIQCSLLFSSSQQQQQFYEVCRLPLNHPAAFFHGYFSLSVEHLWGLFFWWRAWEQKRGWDHRLKDASHLEPNLQPWEEGLRLFRQLSKVFPAGAMFSPTCQCWKPPCWVGPKVHSSTDTEMLSSWCTMGCRNNALAVRYIGNWHLTHIISRRSGMSFISRSTISSLCLWGLRKAA